MIRNSKVYFALLNFLGVQSTDHDLWINFREQDLHRTAFRFFAVPLNVGSVFIRPIFVQPLFRPVFQASDLEKSLK